ncbi:MAG: hypothetical protein ACYC4L_13375 [Chloroflexota bacterium]
MSPQDNAEKTTQGWHMRDEQKTREQLVAESAELRRKVADL